MKQEGIIVVIGADVDSYLNTIAISFMHTGITDNHIYQHFDTF